MRESEWLATWVSTPAKAAKCNRLCGRGARVSSLLFLQLVECSQDFIAVSRGIHACIRLGDFAAGVDDEGVPLSKLHHAQVLEGAVLVRDLVVGVGQQFEVQAFLVAN